MSKSNVQTTEKQEIVTNEKLKVLTTLRYNPANNYQLNKIDIEKHLNDFETLQKRIVPIDKEKNATFDFSFFIDKKQDFYSIPISILRYLLLMKNNYKTFAIGDLKTSKEKKQRDFCQFNFATKKESNFDWNFYFKNVLTFKYNIKINGYYIVKLKGSQNVLFLNESKYKEIAKRDYITFSRLQW